jgi:hypothetical protein
MGTTMPGLLTWVSLNFCPGWHQTVIFLIFGVAGIAGMQYHTQLLLLFEYFVSKEDAPLIFLIKA